ncbi:MAG: hypothetical protein ACI9VM_000823 [Candidatus Azotimanducaceae bacterium]|jgi:hypothetical protein
MANLIPPDAKHAITVEYWLRVVTVWFVLIGLALIVVAVLQFPTYVLVQTQLDAFSGKYNDANNSVETFAEAQRVLVEVNDLSSLLTSSIADIGLSNLVDVLDAIAGDSVTISNFSFKRSETELIEIHINGLAKTRTALANFSNDIEDHPLFTEADVPISNLAKDKDILFDIDIKPALP